MRCGILYGLVLQTKYNIGQRPWHIIILWVDGQLQSTTYLPINLKNEQNKTAYDGQGGSASGDVSVYFCVSNTRYFYKIFSLAQSCLFFRVYVGISVFQNK